MKEKRNFKLNLKKMKKKQNKNRVYSGYLNQNKQMKLEVEICLNFKIGKKTINIATCKKKFDFWDYEKVVTGKIMDVVNGRLYQIRIS